MSITALTRNAVYGQNGMICSNSPLAAAAGLRVLQEGGNAFDAALAVAAVECVTLVPVCGLGGDSFILAYDAKSGRVTNINSSGIAASGAEAEYYRSQGLALMPIQGPHSISVPGEAAAWETVHRDFLHYALCRSAGARHWVRRARIPGIAAHRPVFRGECRVTGAFRRYRGHLPVEQWPSASGR